MNILIYNLREQDYHFFSNKIFKNIEIINNIHCSYNKYLCELLVNYKLVNYQELNPDKLSLYVNNNNIHVVICNTMLNKLSGISKNCNVICVNKKTHLNCIDKLKDCIKKFSKTNVYKPYASLEPETKVSTRPEPKVSTRPEPKVSTRPEPKVSTRPESKVSTRPETKVSKQSTTSEYILGDKYLDNYNVSKFTEKPTSFISESIVNFTRNFLTEPLDFIKNKKTVTLDNIDSFVMIVDFYNGGGGTTTFLNFLVSKYKYYNNFVIVRENNSKCFVTLNDDYFIFDTITNNDFFEIIISNINKLDFVFVNHFYGISDNFIDLTFELKKFDKKIITITHDYYFFYKKEQQFFSEEFNLEKKKYTDNFDAILTQHTVNLSYFRGDNVVLIDMPDYKNRYEFIVNDKNKNCVVGIIGNINKLKGLNFLKKLIDYYPNINFVVFGYATISKCKNLIIYSYSNIDELNTLLKTYNPTVLLELSEWPETYSYTLTLAYIINLPLLILKKPCQNVIVERAKKLGIEYYIFETSEEFYTLANNKSKYHFYTIEPIVYFNRGLDELFVKDININSLKFSSNKPSCNNYLIYFPQFHEIRENNINFYPGYTDAINLHKLIKSNYKNEILTPDFEYFKINNVEEYNLIKNKNIIEKQVDLVKAYKTGIACYYYWFSINSITNQNMIMKEVIDVLFNECEIKNTNIFFIWANEDWSKNPAFTTSNTHTIINNYTHENIKNNLNNLLPYFNKKCYLKINNNPVFMIYHTWCINFDELNELYEIFNTELIKNGFDGCEIYLNVMNDYNDFDINKFKKFRINFDYKTNKGSRYYIDNQIVLDFEKYIDILTPSFETDCVQTLSLDFDNNARLIEPNKSQLSTLCIKNYHFLKVKFIKLLLSYYENNNDILLINSLNEWGEKMAFEPSNETGFYYLNLLNRLTYL
jgi:hypothetical protein